MTRLLLVSGQETDSEAAKATAALMKKLETVSGLWSAQFPETSISLVMAPYPDGIVETRTYPPVGKAYDDPVHPETLYLWRWLGMLAPDVVLEVCSGQTTAWTIPEAIGDDSPFAKLPGVRRIDGRGSLAPALANNAVCDVASVPALALQATSEADLLPLLRELQRRSVRSTAREELSRRRNRSPLLVAQELSRKYGQRLDEVAYIPALSLVGRLRLGDLTGDESHRRDVERIARPYYAGEKPTLPVRSNGSQQAGHLIFGELASLAKDPRYIELLQRAADLGFDAQGAPREVMPAHDEMSDAVFLGTPLLVQTAKLTGDSKYRDLAMSHLRFMVKLNRRADGLHRHSPVADDATAWGRGNGFVILGLALTLSELPENSPDFREVLKLYRDHLAAMMPHQDELGMWHQVIDHPESYREYTVSCMTAFAIVRGLRRGWIDRSNFEPALERTWLSIKQRTTPGGALVDVCAGTGKMKSLREYLDRPAILGTDDRGGAMALLLCTELAYAEREGKLSLK